MSRKIDNPGFKVEFLRSIEDIDAQAWNTLAASESPFLKHEFLLALEQCDCTTRATGWQPYHAVLFDGADKTGESKAVVAILPLFLKYNSYGEYVFDWSWADAYQTHGLDYYPKFLTAIPFTPCASARLMCKVGIPRQEVVATLVNAVETEATRIGASSWHVLFPTRAESELLQEAGLPQRKGCQFHWFNRNYECFDDFLQSLNSRKRKNIRKERKSVSDQGISFEILEGADVSETQWKHFFVFYQTTYLVRGREGYLNQAFFLQLGRTMPENLVLIQAKLGEQIIAGSLFFKQSQKLYGRYWGSLEAYQFLHFETCFYQGIQYCIDHGIKQFDAGAQGEHKIQRGFEPTETFSNHWIADPSFASAIEDFLARETVYIESYIVEAAKLLPFKQSAD